MTSEGNKATAPSDQPPIEQLVSSGAKRKRGRPRKYEHSTYEQPQMAHPVRSMSPGRRVLYNYNMHHGGLHANHTSGGSVGPKMHTVYVLPAPKAQGDRSSRPRNSANTVKVHDNQATNYSSAHVEGNSSTDANIGKRFVGKMANKCPGFSLITVKVKDNQVLQGWIPDVNNLRPITPRDDLVPELPMLRPSSVKKKKASAVHKQTPPPLPVHLEDVTIARPLQMRRPVEKSIATNIIPTTPGVYISPGVVAAAPVSVPSSYVESWPLPKQVTGPIRPEPSATVVPVKFAQPVSISCRQVANEDVLVEGKSVTEATSDSESSNGSDESSAQIQRVDPAAINEIDITSGSKVQSDAADNNQHICKESSDNMEQSEQPQTETNILKGVDGSNLGASDDAHSVNEEDAMKVDSK